MTRRASTSSFPGRNRRVVFEANGDDLVTAIRGGRVPPVMTSRAVLRAAAAIALVCGLSAPRPGVR